MSINQCQENLLIIKRIYCRCEKNELATSRESEFSIALLKKWRASSHDPKGITMDEKISLVSRNIDISSLQDYGETLYSQLMTERRLTGEVGSLDPPAK